MAVAWRSRAAAAAPRFARADERRPRTAGGNLANPLNLLNLLNPLNPLNLLNPPTPFSV